MIRCPKCGNSIPLPTTRTLTKRQGEVYRFLVEYRGKHGYAPTFEEIAAALGVSSLATVYEHLNNLELKGYISRRPLEERGITILIGPDPAPVAAS